MSIFSVKRPEKREFRYKPRFYEPDGGIKNDNGEIDPKKMAERLHRSWSAKRKARLQKSPLGFALILSMVIVLILVYMVLQFVLK